MPGDCPGGMGGFGIDWYIKSRDVGLIFLFPAEVVIFHEPYRNSETGYSNSFAELQLTLDLDNWDYL